MCNYRKYKQKKTNKTLQQLIRSKILDNNKLTD